MPVVLTDPDARITVRDADLAGIVNGDPDTTYTIRPISIEQHRGLVKKNTAQVIDRRLQAQVPQVDSAAVSDDVLDYVLVEWSGLLFRGEPVPCERAYKLKLDYVRKSALCDLAGMNQIVRAPEVRAESFREPAGVPAVLGG